MMKKSISIFISFLLLIPALYFVQLDEANARGRHKRQIKRAYVAGAITGQRRERGRHHIRKHRKRARTRRAVRGAVRLGVGAALIHNANERHRDRY